MSSNSVCVVEFRWWQDSRNIEEMRSNVRYEVWITATAQTYSNASIQCTVQCNYISQPTATQTMTLTKGSAAMIAYGDLTIGHNNSGAASPFINVITRVDSLVIPAVTGTLSLNNIVLMGRITSIPTTIYDEDTKFSVAYSISDAWDETEMIEDLELRITYDGILTEVFYPSKLRTAYEVEVYQFIREKIWEGMTDRTDGVVTFNLITTLTNGSSYTDTKTAAYKIINAEPTVEISVVDANSETGNLTGNANTLIKGHSIAEITVTSTPKKKATIVSEVITNGAYTLYGTGSIDEVEDGNFYVNVIDSRGLTAQALHVATLIEYIPITCNLNVDIPTATGETTVNVSGNCFYGSFGAVSNTVSVYYRYAETGNSFSDWLPATAYLGEDNVYYASANVTGLNYTKQYTFEAYAVDKLEAIYSLEVKVKAIPVFDWGENDFNFNVPVNLSQGYTVPLSAMRQLWNGNFQMESSSASITLDMPISDLPNGIVLIFTPWNSSTGLADDNKLMSFFVSKKAIQSMPSKLHTFFLMSGADFATIGAKSLYIGHDSTSGLGKVTGYATNDDYGTKNGITFDNRKFVLRYVLGV